VGKPEGKIPPVRSKRRWEDIKLNLREIEWGGIDWINLAWDRDHWRSLVNAIINLRVPYNVGKFLTGLTTGSFSAPWI
jgi:hypothetical protein